MHSASYGPVLLALVFWFEHVIEASWRVLNMHALWFFLVGGLEWWRLVVLLVSWLAGWTAVCGVRLGVGLIEWKNFEESIRCY